MSKELAVRNSTAKVRKPYQTGQWHETFLVNYAETGHLSGSAAEAGVSREAVYKAKENDPEFAAAFQRARKLAAYELEGEGIRRAKNHSDTLLIFLLKGLLPEVHGDKVLHGHTGEISIKLVYDE
jgi:hypothetical protein